MVRLQLLPVAGFLNNNVKMFQDSSARIYQDRLQDNNVIMFQLKSVIMFLVLFPGKNARMSQQNNAGVLRETSVRMFLRSNAPTHLGKNVHQAQDKNVRKSQNNSAQQQPDKNAGMFHLSSVKLCQDR